MLSTQNCSGKLNNLVAPTHLELRSPMFGEFWVFFFCVVLKGIDDFEGGFMYKADYRKSSKIMFTLSMP